MTKTTLEQFRADIDDLALDLVRAHRLTFGDPAAPPAKDMALYRWLDYRLRHMDPRPRKIEKSARFPVQGLPSDIGQALGVLGARLARGDDVNPFLSKTTVGNDVLAQKSQRRTDGLWADWRIHHFHLTTEPLAAGDRFSQRSGWLLFAMVYDDMVALIDVRRHDEDDLWSQTELFKAFVEGWPTLAEPFRITGMLLDSQPTTSESLGMRRREGVIAPVEHNGHHYFRARRRRHFVGDVDRGQHGCRDGQTKRSSSSRLSRSARRRPPCRARLARDRASAVLSRRWRPRARHRGAQKSQSCVAASHVQWTGTARPVQRGTRRTVA